MSSGGAVFERAGVTFNLFLPNVGQVRPSGSYRAPETVINILFVGASRRTRF
jgi:hypothetical protein